MKKLACLAAFAIIPLTACTTVPLQTTAAPASGATMYCWKNRLAGAPGKLECNWEATRKAACESDGFAIVDESRYSAPAPAGMCANGQYLVMVQSR